MTASFDLSQELGNIDIYLLDQVMRGRFSNGDRILDAGCGGGRNLVYFLRNGFDVHGVDSNPGAITAARELAARLGRAEDAVQRFVIAELETLPHPDACFDAVICNAVLHMAGSEGQFDAMLRGIWRVLAPRGMLFVRLTSNIGIESLVQQVAGRRHRLPDGSERFLVDLPMLLELTEELGAELLDPIKTVNVQNQRCMTTWVMRKIPSS